MTDPDPVSVESAPTPPTRRPRRRWLRFGLRTMLVLVALIALPLGWWVNTVRRQGEAVATIRAFTPATHVYYEEEADFGSWPAWLARPLIWVRDRIPLDYRQAVVEIDVVGGQSPNPTPTATEATAAALRLDRLKTLHLAVPVRDADLSLLPRLTHLKRLRLYLPSPNLTDTGLASIAAVSSLEVVAISDCAATDAGLAQLAALTRLETLWLGDADEVVRGRAQIRVTGSGLASLANLPTLTTVALRSPSLTHEGITKLGLFRLISQLEICGPVTNDDVSQLASLSHLTHLTLSSTRLDGTNLDLLADCPELSNMILRFNSIGDSAVPALGRLTSLESLWLQDTDLTAAGVGRLQEQLPDLTIKVYPIGPGEPQRTPTTSPPGAATPTR